MKNEVQLLRSGLQYNRAYCPTSRTDLARQRVQVQQPCTWWEKDTMVHSFAIAIRSMNEERFVFIFVARGLIGWLYVSYICRYV